MHPLLIATLAGDVEEYAPQLLGRSWFRRAASAVKHAAAVAVNPVAQARNIGHTAARIGRATGRVAMDVSRGNIKQAFIDTGRAITTTVAAPLTFAAGSIGQGKKLEGVIDRNDPLALLNRKILQGVVAAVRPIVRSFAGEEVALFGDSEAIKKSLREQKAKIVTLSAGAGTAAGMAIGGPPGAAIGAALVPTAVDIAIEELANAAKNAILGTPAGAPAAKKAAATGKIFGLPASVVVGGGALAAYLILKKKGH